MAVTKKLTKADLSGVRIECFMLCNFAQVESGKLNIIGGGWTEVVVTEFPAPFAYYLAVKLAVPVAQRELLAEMRIRLVEEQRPEVLDDRRIELDLTELGDIALDARSIAFASVIVMQLEISKPGRFHTELWIAGQMVTTSGFAVKDPLAGQISVEEIENPIG